MEVERGPNDVFGERAGVPAGDIGEEGCGRSYSKPGPPDWTERKKFLSSLIVSTSRTVFGP